MAPTGADRDDRDKEELPSQGAFRPLQGQYLRALLNDLDAQAQKLEAAVQMQDLLARLKDAERDAVLRAPETARALLGLRRGLNDAEWEAVLRALGKMQAGLESDPPHRGRGSPTGG
jgi:hypothetical protein